MPRSPWLQILAGLVFGTALGCLLLVPGCGASTLAQCRIDAVRDAAIALPEDETRVSIGDVIGVVRRLAQCREAETPPSSRPDGGVPP
jgi:hypothetical protein